MTSTRFGVDIGGTFTDVAAVDETGRLFIAKCLTTHGAEHEAFLDGIRESGAPLTNPDTIIAHGTTLVINSLLERRGARVALLTTKGFPDVLDIGRGNRSEIFTLRFHRDAPLVPAELCFEVDERTYGDGTVALVPSEDELAALVDRLREARIGAVAVAFLNSYLCPDNERRVGDAIARAMPGIPVTLSSDISRQWREYERTTTAVANAYVAPVVDAYIGRLTDGIDAAGFGKLIVLDSSGGAMTVDDARRFPVRIVESGPVGGAIGARALATAMGIDNIVTFDMGGTTAKSTLVEGAQYPTKDQYWIGGETRGFPLQISTVDIVEVSVGGGSIAWLDADGQLQIGPRSAGSRPGPACYGLGGTDATLTDANLYCGRLASRHFSGRLTLDEAAARRAIETLAAKASMDPSRLALGMIQLANMKAASAVRRQTLERGYSPEGFTMLSSGGAGGLHACEIAAQLGIRRVLVPILPGHFSALGMLQANLRVDRRELLAGDLASVRPDRLRDKVGAVVAELSRSLDIGSQSSLGIRASYSVAVRYKGQDHALWVSDRAGGLDVPDDIATRLREAFDAEYSRRYGHLNELSELETVELLVVAEQVLPSQPIGYPTYGEPAEEQGASLWAGEAGPLATRVISRDTVRPGVELAGPAIVYEPGATTVLPPAARCTMQDDGTLLIDLSPLAVHAKRGSP